MKEIKRNSSKCKYVEIFTRHVGSIGAPSRRTVFVRETSAEQIIIIIANLIQKSEGRVLILCSSEGSVEATCLCA
jgi:hypothetical protein